MAYKTTGMFKYLQNTVSVDFPVFIKKGNSCSLCD